MQLVNSTICKTIAVLTLFISLQTNLKAQGNSPFSRYGIGDLVNNSNVLNRGMGSISVGLKSDRFLNHSNPASYSWLGEPLNAKKIGGDFGKLISFEVGSEYHGSTLKQATPLNSYKANNLVFNYMQLGMQVSKKGNWGVTFGLLPVARENYKIGNAKRLTNIDSIITVYEGNGGAYKFLVGTGYRVGKFSLGINTGYLFAKKTSSTNINLINDSIQYYESTSNNKLNFGNVFLHTGVLYNTVLTDSKNKLSTLSFGATYELQNKMKSSLDVERLVYDDNNTNNPAAGYDSIFVQKNVPGTVTIPSTFALGFSYSTINKKLDNKLAFGVDYTTTAWNNFRINNAADQVQNSWLLKSGIEWKPTYNDKRYWSKVMYRTGFYVGRDYIKAGGDLPTYAFTLGMGLPVANGRKLGLNSAYINLAMEAGKRGNTANNLTENFVKVALSVSLADIWFIKRKYD